MLKKSLSFLIAAGVLSLGLNAFAEEESTVTLPQDQTQIREQKRDGTGSQDRVGTMQQDRDRTGVHQVSGSGTGLKQQSSGSGMKGGRGGGSGMGGGRR